MCQNRLFVREVVAAQYMVESSWNPRAKGDYANGVPQSFGLGQIQVAAARDVGWTGTNTDELFDPLLNITLSTAYLSLCRDWAHKYDKRNEIATYGEMECALSVYKQGPGGFSAVGITRNFESYVKPIRNWYAEIAAGGIVADDGSTVPPGGGGTTPYPPVPTPTPAPTLTEEIDKWSESLRKYLADVKAVHPWPPASDYETDLGRALYMLATTIRDLRARIESWLGELG